MSISGAIESLDEAYAALRGLHSFELGTCFVFISLFARIAICVLLALAANKLRVGDLRNKMLIFGLLGILFPIFWVVAGIILVKSERMGRIVKRRIASPVWKVFWGVEAVFWGWFFFYFLRYEKPLRQIVFLDSYMSYAISNGYELIIVMLVESAVIVVGAVIALLRIGKGDGNALWKAHIFNLMFLAGFAPAVVLYNSGLFFTIYVIVFLASTGMAIYNGILLLLAASGTASSGLGGLDKGIIWLRAFLSSLFRQAHGAISTDKGMKCPNCGKRITQEMAFCPGCATDLRGATHAERDKCKHCGASVKPGQRFCGKCGKPI